MLNEGELAKSAGSFQAAALGQMTWEAALHDFADALRAPHGQLVALGRAGLPAINITTRISPDDLAELDAIGGHAPEINSRVRTGLNAPEMQFFDEAHFTTERDFSAFPAYGDWMQRHAVGYSCITNLLRDKDMLVGMATLRARSQGPMNDEEKRGFMTLAAHARSAVVLSMTFEQQRAKALAAAFESTSVAAVICDLQGNVSAMTPGAERLLAGDRFARVSGRRLVPCRPEARGRFHAKLAAALRSRIRVDTAPPTPMALTAPDGERLIVEFAPLPYEAGFTYSAAVMVILRSGGRPVETRTAIARELFGLTATEQQVASFLLLGRSPADIAEATGRTVGTVRNHVHRILSKSDCTSQVEFLALMARFD